MLGVWIEIWHWCTLHICVSVTPYVGSVDWNKSVYPIIPGINRHSLCWECGLKLSNVCIYNDTTQSLPMLGVWIEIVKGSARLPASFVTPYVGSVDWNYSFVVFKLCFTVTPYVGSVDWNMSIEQKLSMVNVTPYVGSVDWNFLLIQLFYLAKGHSLCWECGLK